MHVIRIFGERATWLHSTCAWRWAVLTKVNGSRQIFFLHGQMHACAGSMLEATNTSLDMYSYVSPDSSKWPFAYTWRRRPVIILPAPKVSSKGHCGWIFRPCSHLLTPYKYLLLLTLHLTPRRETEGHTQRNGGRHRTRVQLRGQSEEEMLICIHCIEGTVDRCGYSRG
jgi:hypothetical protein